MAVDCALGQPMFPGEPAQRPTSRSGLLVATSLGVARGRAGSTEEVSADGHQIREVMSFQGSLSIERMPGRFAEAVYAQKRLLGA
jgi:hypothetical protein